MLALLLALALALVLALALALALTVIPVLHLVIGHSFLIFASRTYLSYKEDVSIPVLSLFPFSFRPILYNSLSLARGSSPFSVLLPRIRSPLHLLTPGRSSPEGSFLFVYGSSLIWLFVYHISYTCLDYKEKVQQLTQSRKNEIVL